MGKREIKDQVAGSSVVMQKPPYLDISALLPPACCNFCLCAHFKSEGTKERLELHDGSIVRLGRSSHRLTAMDMIGWYMVSPARSA